MLLIDGIQNVTMVNGLVRIQVVQTGADGKNKGVEEIAIPSNQYANVVQALQQAGQNLQQRLQEQQKQQAGQQQSGQQAAAEPAQADELDFSNS
jgi:Skp family chaperone for outer membrane proteins